jgi:Ca2+-binding RTX toxin-like protein
MAGPIDFSTGNWVDSDDTFPYTPNLPALKVTVGIYGPDTYLAENGSHVLAGYLGGATVITGTGGNDGFYVGWAAGGTNITGLGGTDAFYLGDGNDTAYGGDGNDGINQDTSFGTIPNHVRDGNDKLFGGTGEDNIVDWGGDTLTVAGGPDNDTVAFIGTSTSVTVDAGTGNDEIWYFDYSGATGLVDGGSGTDTLRLLALDIHPFPSVLHPADLTTLTLHNIEKLELDAFDVKIKASELAKFQEISAFGGEINLEATGNKDVVHPEVLHLETKLQTDITINGSSDAEAIFGASSFSNKLYGGSGGDGLYGGSKNDYLYGGDGNDILSGLGGNDHIYGGPNNPIDDPHRDYLNGGAGVNVLAGGPGPDVYFDYVLPLDVIVEKPNEGIDELDTKFNRTLPANVEILDLLGKNVNGTGNASNNQIKGTSGNNQLSGQGGNDTLQGEGGTDVLKGGSGKDILNGGPGHDMLYGGPGPDRFDFNNVNESAVGLHHDAVQDFSEAQQDRIDLTGIDANTHKVGNQPFHFIGAGHFSSNVAHHVCGELRYANHLLQSDVNGDGKPDFEIHVNLATLVKSDFLL